MSHSGDASAISHETYRRITDYLASLYGKPLYTHGGLAHPVMFYEAAAEQVQNVDSVLGRSPTETLTQAALSVYNYAYLHTLQNSPRHLYNGLTFALKHIRTNPLRIEAVFGRYYDMIATCAALEHELLEAAPTKRIRLPLRTQYHRDISPQRALTQGRGRSAAIGVVALTVFNDAGVYRALISRRTASHATRPNAYHLLPTFIFQPMGEALRPGDWSIQQHFYREWLEELFGLPESDTWDFDAHPALLDLRQMQQERRAGLYLTGIAMNLLTLRPDICLLLLIHDPDWWPRVTALDSPLRLDTQAESAGRLLLAPIASDAALLAALPDGAHRIMVPHAIAALWQGVAQARQLIDGL